MPDYDSVTSKTDVCRVGKFTTQCKKLWIKPGFMTSCHKQVYDGLYDMIA